MTFLIVIALAIVLLVGAFLLFVLGQKDVEKSWGFGIGACAIVILLSSAIIDSSVDAPAKKSIYASMQVSSAKDLRAKYADARIGKVFSVKRKTKVIYMLTFTTLDRELHYARISKEFYDHLKSRDAKRLVPEDFTPQGSEEAPAAP